MAKKKAKKNEDPVPVAGPTPQAPPPAFGPIEAPVEVIEPELTMSYWRSLAREALPDTAGPWEESELGACFQQMVQTIKRHYTQMDRIARESGEKTLIFGIKFSICRKKTPPEAKVDIAYSQNWKDTAKVLVPDPAQEELPLSVVKNTPVVQGDQEGRDEDEEAAQAIREAELEEQRKWNQDQAKLKAQQNEAKFDEKVRDDLDEDEDQKL